MAEENASASEESEQESVYPAQVASVRDPFKLVINRGSEDGVKEGQRFLVYMLSEEDIEDPESGDSLGKLEIVKGTGRATHVQDHMTTIKSDKTEDVGSSQGRRGRAGAGGPMGGPGGGPGGGSPMGGGGMPGPMGGGGMGPGGGGGNPLGGGGNPLAAMAQMAGQQQGGGESAEPSIKPFEDPEVGDLVRPISSPR